MVPGLKERFLFSARNLVKTRTLTMAAMLMALQIVLSMTATIPLGPYLQIGFSYLAVVAAAYLLGPTVAMCNAVLVDLILCLIRPTGPFHPGFTLNALLGGLIYGVFLYRRPLGWKNVMLSKLVIDLVVNILLGTIWIHQLYGKAFWVLVPSRALKNLIQYPVDVLLMTPVLLFLKRVAGKSAWGKDLLSE